MRTSRFAVYNIREIEENRGTGFICAYDTNLSNMFPPIFTTDKNGRKIKVNPAFSWAKQTAKKHKELTKADCAVVLEEDDERVIHYETRKNNS